MMVESYKTVAREAKDEFTEKKSVFIGHESLDVDP